MGTPPVYIVHLRRPFLREPKEERADPFWEFGSFGCTGCHSHNLLHPRNAEKLTGARLAFAQGGGDGFRLVLLTPVVAVENLGKRFEVRWKPRMPFKYAEAPVLVANDGRSDFPALKRFVARVNRTTLEGAFSSSFRSRCSPIDTRVAEQIIDVFDAARKGAGSRLARTYDEALPYPPPTIQQNRKRSYLDKVREATGMAARPKRSCAKPERNRKLPDAEHGSELLHRRGRRKSC